jgi:hypothetical protein
VVDEARIAEYADIIPHRRASLTILDISVTISQS